MHGQSSSLSPLDTFAIINVSDVMLMRTLHSKHQLLSKKPHFSNVHSIAVLDPLLHRYRAAQSYKSATSPSRIAVLAPDMRRVRLQQQQIAQERSVEAETERKRKEKEVRERRRVKSPEEERWDRLGGEGVVLGDGENGGRKKSGQVQVKKQR
jgi:hypothetical protein